MVTHCCHPGHGRPSVWEEPIISRGASSTRVDSGKTIHQQQLPSYVPWGPGLLLCLCLPLPPSSPGERHGDSADTEMGRPALQRIYLPFTGALLSNSTSKGWFNLLAHSTKPTKLLFCPLAKMNVLQSHYH